MKSITAILLIFALSFQCFVKIGIWGAYMANKDYIAKVLCVNRDKPTMNCKGKCHLKKQLAQHDAKEKNAGYSKSTEIPLFHAPTLSHTILPGTDNTVDVLMLQVSSKTLIGTSLRIFHPPQYLA